MIGREMSAGIYKAERAPASANVTIYADGHAASRLRAEGEKYSGKSFAVHFVEVEVDELTWGIGIALMEEGVVDHRCGRRGLVRELPITVEKLL
jgi:hypothetical protein